MFSSFLVPATTAVALGYFIGLEREWHNHFAGMRTNALVSLGACIFVHLGLVLNGEHGGDTTRVLAQVVSGLGFLGAGVILKDGVRVHGLTTAATIWVAGAVGSLCGVEHFMDAIIVAWFVVVVNWLKFRD